MSGARSSSIRTFGVCAVLFLGTVAVFSRSLGLGFINYDDPSYVVNNIHVQRGLTWDGVTWAFAVGRAYWHPFTWLSLMADHELFGDDARGYHLVNVIWHACNALLVFAVTRRMTGGFWAGALGAALFAWHPLRVESVTWITERKDVLSGFFGLLAIWSHLRFGEAMMRGDGRAHARPGAWYALTLTALACGLMSKSVLVTLPFVFLLLDLWPLRRDRGAAGDAKVWARLVAEKIPFLLLSVLVGLFTVATQDTSGAFALPLSLDQRVANAVVSIARYVGLFFCPSGLAVVYPHPGHWPVLIVGAATAGVGVFTVFAWWQRQDSPWVFVGWGWFLCLLAPVLGLVQVGLQAMADRYTYLSIIGLQVMLIGAAGAWMTRRTGAVRIVAVAMAAVAIAGCAIRTWDQQSVWRDADALFGHTLSVTQDNYVAHTALALSLLEAGRMDEAAAHAESAVAIARESPLVHDGLALVREAQGRTSEAIVEFSRVIELQPRSAPAKCDLARLLLKQGRSAEAEALLEEARTQHPEWVPAHMGLADVALMRGRPADALAHLEAAIALRPRDGELLLRRAAVQVRLGRTDEAAGSLLGAARLAAADAQAQIAIGDALGQIGRFEEAALCYETAVTVAPGDAGAHARLGYVMFLLKRHDDAIRCWEEALRLDPKMTDLNERIRQVRNAKSAGP